VSARRPVPRRRLGVAAGFVCATAAAGTGVLLAAPAQAQAMGVFLYTDASGVIVPAFFPAEEKCFDVFKGKEAKNLTGSDAILFKDGLCSEVLIKLTPGETLNLTFNSYGFTPAGATGNPPGSWEPASRPGP
jgi:hypothetical protein